MSDGAAPGGSDGPEFPRWLKWSLLGALAVLVLGYGAIFLYAKVLNDSPAALDEGDLDAALATDPPPATGSPTDTGSPDTGPTDTGATGTGSDDATVTSVPDAPGPVTVAAPAGTGTWMVTDASELGYRVKEVLFGVDSVAAGRTDRITGTMTIDDGTTVTTADFVVDVATITSDDGRRDGQFRGRIMSTDEFPEAVFSLTEPIDLGVEVTEGAEVATTATGDLTLRGVTNTVTFDLTARLENGKIGVFGTIPVVFADYAIPNPSFGGVSTEDNGLLEFVLVFEPA